MDWWGGGVWGVDGWLEKALVRRCGYLDLTFDLAVLTLTFPGYILETERCRMLIIHGRNIG